jgi:hypothetical protein
MKTEMEKHECVSKCLTLGTVGAGVWKRDKMSHNNPGKFTIRQAQFSIFARLNPGSRIEVNYG